jgi:LTXXQ motif family protein
MRRTPLFALAMLISFFSMSAIGLAQQSDTDQSRQPGNGMMGPGMMGYGGMGPGMMGRNGMMTPGMMGPGMMMGYGPTMEGQLAYVKAELGITDAQKQAWDAYVSAIKARADTMQSMHSAMMKAMQTGSALERMEARTNAMQSMVESMKAIKPATESLYKALTDEQKKKADLLLGNGCCMM